MPSLSARCTRKILSRSFSMATGSSSFWSRRSCCRWPSRSCATGSSWCTLPITTASPTITGRRAKAPSHGTARWGRCARSATRDSPTSTWPARTRISTPRSARGGLSFWPVCDAEPPHPSPLPLQGGEVNAEQLPDELDALARRRVEIRLKHHLQPNAAAITDGAQRPSHGGKVQMPPSWGVAVAVGEMHVFQARPGLVNRSGDGRLLDVHVKGIEHQPDVGKVHRLE